MSKNGSGRTRTALRITVKGLLTAYGLTGAREIDAFLALAKEASQPGWWHSYMHPAIDGPFRIFRFETATT